MVNKKKSATLCKIAIIGAGQMAREHIRAFQDLDTVEIVGIHSRTRNRAEVLAKEFNIPNVFDSISELYEKTEATLVIVAVTILATREICNACFKYPWVALIEKPAGYNLADAEAIAEDANSKGRRVYVALNRRHYGVTRTVASDLAKLAGPRLVKVQDQQSLLLARQLGHPQLVIDNWFHACSIHLIDYFLLFCRGKISGVDHIIQWNPMQPRYVVAKVNFDSGDVGIYEAIWEGPGPWAVSVCTPEKRWELRPLEKASYQLAGQRVLIPIEDDNVDIHFKAGLRRQAELAVLATSNHQTELPTLEDALLTMQLTQAIYS